MPAAAALELLVGKGLLETFTSPQKKKKRHLLPSFSFPSLNHILKAKEEVQCLGPLLGTGQRGCGASE